MKRLLCCLGGIIVTSVTVQAQVLLSGGLTYSQNFDSLPSTPTSGTWIDNSTTYGLTGWYASRTNAAGGNQAFTAIRVDNGNNNSGSIYSYGSASASDRALGSLSSGTPNTVGLGLLFKNDTGSTFTGNISIAYTGEQWRQGANTTPQTILYFSYGVFNTDISGAVLAGSITDPTYTADTTLNFNGPQAGAAALALDGNASANRVALSDTLSSITLNPGDEIMLRWSDINDIGNDHGGGIDDLAVTFTAGSVPEPGVLSLLGGFGMLALWLRRKK